MMNRKIDIRHFSFPDKQSGKQESRKWELPRWTAKPRGSRCEARERAASTEETSLLLFPICNLQSAICNFRRGHSSVGRAPALQAGSQGFESPCLQSLQGGGGTSLRGAIIGSP